MKILSNLKPSALAHSLLVTKVNKRYLIGITLIITGLSTHPVFGQTLSMAASLLNIQSNGIQKTESILNAQSNDLLKAAILLNIQIKKPSKRPDVRVTAKGTTKLDDVISHLNNQVKGVLVLQKTALTLERETANQEVAAAQKAVASIKAAQRQAKLQRFQRIAARKVNRPMPLVINKSKTAKPKIETNNLAEAK